ncbi:2669_t:CDS:2 [Funneliformis geosporum]|uniref:13685_t:CDS:1 n=1 Tax=Funneliformis geosporum TaxID=1117311 RepID=A0A9W4SR25_9GLOM|nr:2669_t:CDS:2 [Funneliformis geosporum]CAI2178160.1 13685_t:CDS:2 [Funneliformis geosporum]
MDLDDKPFGIVTIDPTKKRRIDDRKSYKTSDPKSLAANSSQIRASNILLYQILNWNRNNLLRATWEGRPQGVRKSYFALYNVARAYAEKWLLFYISDAAKLDQPAMKMSSDEIFTVECGANIFTNVLQQVNRKTLLFVEADGVTDS